MHLCDPHDPTFYDWIGEDTAPNIHYWPLQWATQEACTRGIFTEAHVQMLFEQAFGKAFTTQYHVQYVRDIAWLARFEIPARAEKSYFDLPVGASMVPVEVCFNAPYHWRVSQHYGITSIPFEHHTDPNHLLLNLAEALQRVI